MEVKEQKEINNLAIVRLEQIYPFPEAKLADVISKYGKNCKHLWAQEEPENMGAWSFILRFWKFGPITCCSRHMSASPASGSAKVHEIRHQAVINEVMMQAIEKTSKN